MAEENNTTEELEVSETEAAPEEEAASETEVSDNQLPSVQQLVIALSILVFIFGLSYIPGFRKHEQQSAPTAIEERITEQIVKEEPRERVDHFAGIEVQADAAYVWDVREQRALFNKNAGVQLPLASLTKMMTALVAHETLSAEEAVDITLDAILQDGESFFIHGQEFSAKSLTDLTLITSSNDGAYALAAAAGSALGQTSSPTNMFIEEMNKRAEEIGLSQTYFTNPTGLDTNEVQSGSYGSARDMAFLMEYLINERPEVLESTTHESSTVVANDGVRFIATNTNEITEEIPHLLGSKTGYTILAGGNLVIAFDAGLNRPIIVSVMGSSRSGRFDDVLTLTAAAQQAIINE